MKQQTLTIFGFGSQGRAQALNAQESGWKVRVFLRAESLKLDEAKKLGFECATDPIATAKDADIAMLLIPDSVQPEFYRDILHPHLPKNASLIFAHGYNIHFGYIQPRADIDCLLVAPSLQGDGLRAHYEQNEIVPILTAVHQDASDLGFRLVEDLARAIGGKKTKIIPTTFKEETETDLFAEQAILCGGLSSLIKAGFETLAAKGYNPEIAYFCCLKEGKTLMHSIYQHGLAGFRKKISDTARYGDLTRGPRVINESVKQEMSKILDEICSGDFAKELLKEKISGWPTLKKRLAEEEKHFIEKVRNDVER